MSSGSSTTTVRKKGFLSKDIEAFRKAGARIASLKTDISSFRPTVKERTRTETQEGTLFGVGKGKISASEAGPEAGEFSDISKEQLELMAKLFLSRQKDVAARRLRPGRRQTVLTR
jgi:hypothetical protein